MEMLRFSNLTLRLRILIALSVALMLMLGAGRGALAQSDQQGRIAEAERAVVRGEELLGSGRDKEAIAEYHRGLIALGAQVPPEAYTGEDAQKSYAEVRFEDLEEPMLVGDLLGRVAEAYLRGFFHRRARRQQALSVPGVGQGETDLFGSSHGHGTAANEASIHVLEKVRDLLVQQAGFVGLHERRKVAQLLRRAYDLEIEDLLDLTYLLGGDNTMTFGLFVKVLQYRSRTLLDALWLRRLSFRNFASQDQLGRMSNDFLALIARWNATGLRFGYLRDAVLSEIKEKDSRKDLVAQLRSDGEQAQADVQTVNGLFQTALSHTDKQVSELLDKFGMYPRNKLSVAFFTVTPSLTSTDVLIQYHETQQHLLAFVYDPAYESVENRVSLLLISRDPAAVREKVNTFRSKLEQEPPSSLWELDASDLYLRLLAPLAPALRGKERIFIVPSGSLNGLPFQALIDPRQGEPPLVVLLPHAEILGEWMSAPVLAADRTRALVIGIGEFSSWDRLKRAEAEARAVAGLFDPNATLLLGSRGEAKRTKILEQMPRHGIVHIASHASFDRRAMNSAVVVRGDADSDERITGFDFLRPEMRLDGALVTLSACNTGGLQTDRDEDPLGLASALLIAGAGAVVVSHWPVQDQATELVMTDFYDQLIHHSKSADKALAHATTRLRTEKPKFAHPHYWAAFVVIGDGRWRLPAGDVR